MSDAEAEIAEQDTDQPDESTDEEADELPDIDESEQADLSGVSDVDPGEIEEAAGAGAVDADGDTDGSEDEPDAEQDGESGTQTGGGQWGEMYVQGLTQTANILRAEYGDGGEADPDLAYQIDLDQHFNAWMDSKGFGDEMPPEQAVLVGSLMYLVASVGTDTELMGSLAEQL